ncbi:hypothetical protein D3C85_1292380 [compost metagenome]
MQRHRRSWIGVRAIARIGVDHRALRYYRPAILLCPRNWETTHLERLGQVLTLFLIDLPDRYRTNGERIRKREKFDALKGSCPLLAGGIWYFRRCTRQHSIVATGLEADTAGGAFQPRSDADILSGRASLAGAGKIRAVCRWHAEAGHCAADPPARIHRVWSGPVVGKRENFLR